MKSIKVNDGAAIPQLGLGLWQVSHEETLSSVKTALSAGYRSIDSAQIYKNEDSLGAAIKATSVPRAELYITTKIWNEFQGRDKTLRSFDESMDKLGLEYLDLLLIHWPSPHRGLFVETWKTLVEIRKSARVRSIGVSNFRPGDLKEIIDATGVVPAVNQIELHPKFQQKELQALHTELGIRTECWSPLGQGQVINDPVIQKIAQKHGSSPAQIILRWHIENEFIVIPKSVTPARIIENINVFDFKLGPEDLKAIAQLDQADGRIGPDPSTAAF